MRLIFALLISVAAHTAFLLLPSGRFGDGALLSPGIKDASSQKNHKFEISFRPLAPEEKVGPKPPTSVKTQPVASLQPEISTSTGHDSRTTNETVPALEAFGPDVADWGIPVARYFTPQELTQRPKAPEGFNPEAAELQTLDGSGKMILALYISAEGYVDHIDVENGDISGDLRRILVSQFLAIRFKPGEKDGISVASRIRIEITVAPLKPLVPPRLPPAGIKPLR